jgi:AcrR family transcriptional regulator
MVSVSAPRSRSAARKRSPDVAQPSPTPAAREPRGARRKRETHDRLLRAAFELIAARGVDAVAVNEITEAADVGFGSFYNHFASKEAIHEAVCRAVFDDFGDALERLTEGHEDAAERISICVRHAVARAHDEPLWGKLLLREAYSPRSLTDGLAGHLLRDIERGIREKRFEVADPLMALMMAGGAVLGCIGIEVSTLDAASFFRPRGISIKRLGERAAAAALRGLGLSDRESTKIAERALAPFAWPRAWG